MARLHRLLPVVVALSLGAQLAAAPAFAAPATASVGAAPATPVGLTATNGSSWASLSWTQPAVGPRPDHFRVYEGDTVVARNTTTWATVGGLGFGSTHTFRVTAVAADGTESAPSAPVTRTIFVGGAPPQCDPIRPPRLRVTDPGPSAVTIAWDRSDAPVEHRVTVAGRTVSTYDSQLRLGGLAPNEKHTVTVTNHGCLGQSYRSVIEVTAPDGPTQWPNRPTDVTGSGTESSITVSWSAPVGGTQVESYAVFQAGVRIATTRERSLRFAGLWRGDARTITVAAIGHDGAEGPHSSPVTVRTAACDARPPAPEQLTATAVSASSIELRWLTRTQAASFTVLDGERVVATVDVPSARITGLPSGSLHRLRVVSNLSGCGSTPAGGPVEAMTAAGPDDRPGAPTQVRQAPLPTGQDLLGAIALQWQAPAGARPVSYRVYEGATLLGETAQTEFTGHVPPATRHNVVVVAVDEAGNESVPSTAITVTGFYWPAP